jgi:adenine-specific DNA-methyltransferase
MKAQPTSQRLHGSYYTPAPIAKFLAEWAIRAPDATVLEPSCGDGNILMAAALVLLDRGSEALDISQQVCGVELDSEEADKSRVRLASLGIPANGNIQAGDFFAFCSDQLLTGTRFRVILGNPPFIRYQNFQDDQRTAAFRLMEQAGLRPTRLTNAWMPFLVGSTLLLDEQHGRIGMVIPAELMQVTYAGPLREFLSDRYSCITLIAFKKLVFDGLQQEVVLLLGERQGSRRHGIRTIELDDIGALDTYEHTDFLSADVKELDHSKEKWTQYFLTSAQINTLRSARTHPGLARARDLMEIDVGIVTGLNEFFVLSAEEAAKRSLSSYTRPIVTRSAHLSGLDFSYLDLALFTSRGDRSRLLCVPDIPEVALPPVLRTYLEEGASKNYHLGYKCRIRNRWYVVPSTWIPDAFLLRQIHNYPKLVLNRTNATSTDTIHRVRFVDKAMGEHISACFANSLTFAFGEILGRSYGGGLLELEPNEAMELPIPTSNAAMLPLDELHSLTRAGQIEDALDITDRILLAEGMGMTWHSIGLIREAWHRLRDRRLARNHGVSMGPDDKVG